MDDELYIYRRLLECERAIEEKNKVMAERWWGRRWKTSVVLNLEEIAVRTVLKIKE